MKKLETRTVRELMDLAREWGIAGYSKLKKAELVRLLSGSKAIEKFKRSRQPVDTASRTARQAASKVRASSSLSSKTPRKPYQRPDADSRPSARGEPPERVPNPKPKHPSAAAGVAGTKTKVAVSGQAILATPPAGPVTSSPAPAHDSRMVLLVRDPSWLYCYWDLNAEQAAALWRCSQAYLRVVELRGADGPREVQRFEVPPGARSWYIKLETPGRTHRCELGVEGEAGEFESLVHSNLSTSPPERLSSMGQTRYVQHHPAQGKTESLPNLQSDSPGSKRQAEDLVQLSLGQGPGLDSAAAQQALQERIEQSLSSEVLQSQSLVEGSARRQRQAGDDSYWLWVDADIIIYGATVPGSRVTLRGVELPLDETGRFSARFALPDGHLDLPVEGQSPRRIFRKRVRLEVERSSEADSQPKRIGS